MGLLSCASDSFLFPCPVMSPDIKAQLVQTLTHHVLLRFLDVSWTLIWISLFSCFLVAPSWCASRLQSCLASARVGVSVFQIRGRVNFFGTGPARLGVLFLQWSVSLNLKQRETKSACVFTCPFTSFALLKTLLSFAPASVSSFTDDVQLFRIRHQDHNIMMTEFKQTPLLILHFDFINMPPNVKKISLKHKDLALHHNEG